MVKLTARGQAYADRNFCSNCRGARPRPEFIEAKKEKLLDILEQHSVTAKPSAGSTELLSY